MSDVCRFCAREFVGAVARRRPRGRECNDCVKVGPHDYPTLFSNQEGKQKFEVDLKASEEKQTAWSDRIQKYSRGEIQLQPRRGDNSGSGVGRDVVRRTQGRRLQGRRD